jgi:hypothetical protein
MGLMNEARRLSGCLLSARKLMSRLGGILILRNMCRGDFYSRISGTKVGAIKTNLKNAVEVLMAFTVTSFLLSIPIS